MPHEYSTYQLKALLQLAGFRNKFYNIYTNEPNIGKGSVDEIFLRKSIDSFIEIFCQYNFADSDYTILQKESRSSSKMEQWLNHIGIDVILKLITYIIWTDKSVH